MKGHALFQGEIIANKEFQQNVTQTFLDERGFQGSVPVTLNYAAFQQTASFY